MAPACAAATFQALSCKQFFGYAVAPAVCTAVWQCMLHPTLTLFCALQEILRPFLLVCESKNPRLIGAVLGSIQKLLAHNAVSDEGRQQIIQALHQVCANSLSCSCSS
jgi:hypothetical protein